MPDDTPSEQPIDDTPQGTEVEPSTRKDPAEDNPLSDEGTVDNAGKALERERRGRREAERARRESERAQRELEKQLRQFQDKEKTEAERAAARASDAEKRVAGLVQRAVRAEVRALANGFADPDDAPAFLDLSSYAGEDGEIDVEKIKTDLADLLERKPHLARKAQGEPERRRPAPDRTQASSANTPRSANPEDVFAGFIKERLHGR